MVSISSGKQEEEIPQLKNNKDYVTGYVQYVAGDKKVRNSWVRMECLVCGSQVNLRPNLGSPVCHKRICRVIKIITEQGCRHAHFYLTLLRTKYTCPYIFAIHNTKAYLNIIEKMCILTTLLALIRILVHLTMIFHCSHF